MTDHDPARGSQATPADDGLGSDGLRRPCPSITRRRFLAALGASVAVATVGGFGIAVWGRDPAAPSPTTTLRNGPGTSTPPSPPAGTMAVPAARTLVVIEMGGGNDGLNTVVPHASTRYHDLRGDLAVEEPLVLDDEIGLHPSLGFLAERYGEGRLAVVEGIGYPDPDLSHFASMAVWWSGTSGAPGSTGWLGRYLDATVGTEDPLAGVSIGPGPTPALLGDHSFVVSVQDLAGLSPTLPPWIDTADELLAMWKGFAPAAFDGASLLDEVRRAIGGTVSAAEELDTILAEGGTSPPSLDRADGSPRGRRNLSTSLRVAAALVAAAAPPRVVYVHGWGDFDTHEGEARRHEELMTTLDTGLREFFTAVDEAGVADRVLVMTTSEFGRRVAFNGSGTDHGTAAAHLVLGAAVRGGRYGEPPSLTRLDSRGNLVHTVDYRSLYATVLADWLGVDAATILGGEFPRLGFLA